MSLLYSFFTPNPYYADNKPDINYNLFKHFTVWKKGVEGIEGIKGVEGIEGKDGRGEE